MPTGIIAYAEIDCKIRQAKANIYEYSIELLKKCRNLGFKIACLTDLPNGMPDYIFKPAVKKFLPYFDLYVSSQICGARKPNKGGICYIADVFKIREADILFVGDEEKDFLTALNAGCNFTYISDFRKKVLSTTVYRFVDTQKISETL